MCGHTTVGWIVTKYNVLEKLKNIDNTRILEGWFYHSVLYYCSNTRRTTMLVSSCDLMYVIVLQHFYSDIIIEITTQDWIYNENKKKRLRDITNKSGYFRYTCCTYGQANRHHSCICRCTRIHTSHASALLLYELDQAVSHITFLKHKFERENPGNELIYVND